MARDCEGLRHLEGASGSPPVTQPPFTLAAWFNPDRDTNQETVVGLLNWGSLDIQALYIRGDVGGDPVQAYTRDHGSGLSAVANTTSGFSLGVWQHACGVWAATNDRRVYLNGGSKGTDATALATPDMTRIYVGGVVGFSGGWTQYQIDGRVAEAAVWNVALTDAEVAELATGIVAYRVRPESIVAYWPLLGKFWPEPDLVGGFNLTHLNSPPEAVHCRVFHALPVGAGRGGTPVVSGLRLLPSLGVGK